MTVGFGEPLRATQLLWINLVTDIFPELALAQQPPEADVMERPPRPAERPMFTGRDLARIALEGMILTAGAGAAYAYGLARYGAGARAGTLAFTALTSAQLLLVAKFRMAVRDGLVASAGLPRGELDELVRGEGRERASRSHRPVGETEAREPEQATRRRKQRD